MRVKDTSYLEVAVDKRHIVSIGERLYTESVELLRELVNNAYDADAAKVHVRVSSDKIEIRDDGTGMDREGLEQYFLIGSDLKLQETRSPRFGRTRIGQFGIGKFASLAAASRFEVITQHKGFAARVVFDKDDWEADAEKWHLPLEILEPDPERGQGTTVILTRITKTFPLEDVERKLLEGVPLRAPEFDVFLNGRKLVPRSLVGQRIPVLEGCRFGPVTGEVVVVPASMADLTDLGIELRVKGSMVKKDLFGMETWGKVVARIKGEISADFLPVTSDRSNFVTDSPEYQEFIKVMEGIVRQIQRMLGKEADRREDLRAGRAVKDALKRVHRALARNPDLSPFGPIPYGEEGVGGGAVIGFKGGDEENDENVEPEEGAEAGEAKPRPERKKRKRRNPLVKKVTPGAVVRKMMFGESQVAVCLDFFGEGGPECFSEGNVVYVNRDHPLFQRESQKGGGYTMYIARLMTQEISMMHETRSPRLAFNRQSQLLKDAFSDE
jgi:hypothetical protein